MAKNKNIYYSSLSDIELYEELLEGIVDTFPSGFWVNRGVEEAREVAKKLLRYLLIEKLKYTKEDIKKEVSKKFITKYKLHTASKLFGRSSIKYVLESIPELGLQPWQLNNDYVPKNYWTIEENRVSALRYLFEVELKWNIEEVKDALRYEEYNKLKYMNKKPYQRNINRNKVV